MEPLPQERFRRYFIGLMGLPFRSSGYYLLAVVLLLLSSVFGVLVVPVLPVFEVLVVPVLPVFGVLPVPVLPVFGVLVVPAVLPVFGVLVVPVLPVTGLLSATSSLPPLPPLSPLSPPLPPLSPSLPPLSPSLPPLWSFLCFLWCFLSFCHACRASYRGPCVPFWRPCGRPCRLSTFSLASLISSPLFSRNRGLSYVYHRQRHRDHHHTCQKSSHRNLLAALAATCFIAEVFCVTVPP